MKYYSIKLTGRDREICEDNIGTAVSQDGKVNFYLLSDGMGGHNAGEVASNIVVTILADMCKTYVHEDDEKLHDFLEAAIVRADSEIVIRTRSNVDFEGMGATAVILAVVPQEKKLYFVTVGDSRAYIFKKGKLTQVSRDDSMAQMMREQGFSEYDIKRSQYRSTITKAMGFMEGISPNFYVRDFSEAELVLLCSDGLSSYTKDEKISAILSRGVTEVTCDELAALAKDGGSDDDITINIVEI